MIGEPAGAVGLLAISGLTLDLLATPTAKILAQLVLVAWMVAVSVMDHRSGRIPNWITAPVFLGVGAVRLVVAFSGDWGPFAFMFVAWVILFALWMLNFLGGGDAKFLMALFALFPGMEFTAVLALILLVIMVPLLIVEWRGASPGGVVSGLKARLVTGEILPTRDELQSQGRRYAWTFAIPAIVYTVVYW